MNELKQNKTPFPRGYRTKEKTLRMMIDTDVSVEALKDFLIKAMMAVEYQHKKLTVEDLNRTLIEFTDYFIDTEGEKDEQQKDK